MAHVKLFGRGKVLLCFLVVGFGTFFQVCGDEFL